MQILHTNILNIWKQLYKKRMTYRKHQFPLDHPS